MDVPPSTRRANRWLLSALILFAIGLCVLCLLWMRQKVAADGGRVYPPMAASPGPTQTSCRPLADAFKIEFPVRLTFL